MEWTIDTAATHHFCNQREWFHNYQDLPEKDAVLGEGSTKISGIGDITMEIKTETHLAELTLRNVCYSPNMCRNLISGRLIDQAGFKAILGNRKIEIKDPDGSSFFTAYLESNFYVVEGRIVCGKGELPSATSREVQCLKNQRLGFLAYSFWSSEFTRFIKDVKGRKR